MTATRKALAGRALVPALADMDAMTRRRHFMSRRSHARLPYWSPRNHRLDHELNPQDHVHAEEATRDD